MIVKVADHILSPLGESTEANLRSVLAGQTALRRHAGVRGMPEPFVASLFAEGAIAERFAAETGERAAAWPLFEQLAILSVQRALAKVPQIDPASERVRFVVSTTKGNVDLLDDPRGFAPERVWPGVAARCVARWFGNPHPPVVVSNACASGACAQLTAARMLRAGVCDAVIVVGAEYQSKFIVTGFHSFKALAPEACRPFDRDRCGLNPGEAAATIIYVRKPAAEVTAADWVLVRGAIRNDANHISGPSRTGEGCFRALRQTVRPEEIAALAVVNAHGTATLYNDEMESIALTRAGLAGVPVNSLKGCFGHTMGAAGVLETILTQRAIDAGVIPGTRGYAVSGVSQPLLLSADAVPTQRRAFVKLLSGFGGCNAALLFKRGGGDLC